MLAALLALVPAAASAKPLPRFGTFVYSSLCWEKESGDASGVRFALTRGPKGATLVYEYGAGPLQGAQIKSLKLSGDRMEAEASTSDGDLGVAADLGARRAKVSILFDYRKDGPPDVRTLKRIKRFKQKIQTCR
ncbi:MAG: hypothetical protein WDN45_01975 [Caulobacteraceae bacterium]